MASRDIMGLRRCRLSHTNLDVKKVDKSKIDGDNRRKVDRSWVVEYLFADSHHKRVLVLNTYPQERNMSWDEIRERLDAENCFTITMGTLRDAHGAGKLGPHVSTAISKRLAQMGVGHVPQALPLSQNDQVRLFLHGTAVGDIISMVMTPSEANDTKLLDIVEKSDTSYAGIIAQIRDLVG